MTNQHKNIQVLISYHSDNDKEICNQTMEMTEDELRAVTRHLSAMRISDTELMAVVAVKTLHDVCVKLCKKLVDFQV